MIFSSSSLVFSRLSLFIFLFLLFYCLVFSFLVLSCLFLSCLVSLSLSLSVSLCFCLFSLSLSLFLSVSVSVSLCLRVVLCVVVLCGVCGVVCVVWCVARLGTQKKTSVCRCKTSPCVPAPRAHVLPHVRVVPVHTGTFCIYTRRFFGRTHGGQGVIVSAAYQNLATCGHYVLQRSTKETNGSYPFSVLRTGRESNTLPIPPNIRCA